jgi:hypothetical protein
MTNQLIDLMLEDCSYEQLVKIIKHLLAGSDPKMSPTHEDHLKLHQDFEKSNANRPDMKYELKGIQTPDFFGRTKIKRFKSKAFNKAFDYKKDIMPSGDKRSVAYREWKKRQDPNAYKRK